jgi:hypothetical protein
MAPSLGFGLGLTKAEGGSGTAVVLTIQDYMWVVASAGNLTPLAEGTISDFHNTWDLDGTDYTPAAVGAIDDEGHWELDGNLDIQPKDV